MLHFSLKFVNFIKCYPVLREAEEGSLFSIDLHTTLMEDYNTRLHTVHTA